jgi:hypothetical protein
MGASAQPCFFAIAVKTSNSAGMSVGIFMWLKSAASLLDAGRNLLYCGAVTACEYWTRYTHASFSRAACDRIIPPSTPGPSTVLFALKYQYSTARRCLFQYGSLNNPANPGNTSSKGSAGRPENQPGKSRHGYTMCEPHCSHATSFPSYPTANGHTTKAPRAKDRYRRNTSRSALTSLTSKAPYPAPPFEGA